MEGASRVGDSSFYVLFRGNISDGMTDGSIRIAKGRVQIGNRKGEAFFNRGSYVMLRHAAVIRSVWRFVKQQQKLSIEISAFLRAHTVTRALSPRHSRRGEGNGGGGGAAEGELDIDLGCSNTATLTAVLPAPTSMDLAQSLGIIGRSRIFVSPPLRRQCRRRAGPADGQGSDRRRGTAS